MRSRPKAHESRDVRTVTPTLALAPVLDLTYYINTWHATHVLTVPASHEAHPFRPQIFHASSKQLFSHFVTKAEQPA